MLPVRHLSSDELCDPLVSMADQRIDEPHWGAVARRRRTTLGRRGRDQRPRMAFAARRSGSRPPVARTAVESGFTSAARY